ncbi:purine-nucleoside phosphorylase [Microbacterium sp.]|uniref:purine-nucleoside phosphorylase n=1 Tax=Microbacterium sp. TaxID=51671 RepID=UPI0039E67FF8
MSNENPLGAPDADVIAIAADAAADIARLTGVERHDIAVTLGSGWGKAADLIGETVAEIPATEVTGFSRPAAEGHVGTLRSIVTPRGKRVLVIGARTHYYEGKAVRFVVHSVRAAAATGAKIMVLTNGAGSIRPAWGPGTPVLISDHINLTGSSPAQGAKFIDLTDLYSRRLRDIAQSIDPSLPEGVYVQFPGPHYETPAEVRYAKIIGGDLVGMSTALEAIAARQSGLEVLGISLATNLAAGVKTTPLSHQEVLEAGRAAESVIGPLLARIIGAM